MTARLVDFTQHAAVRELARRNCLRHGLSEQETREITHYAVSRLSAGRSPAGALVDASHQALVKAGKARWSWFDKGPGPGEAA